ncbi:MAG TPA: D-Ala-D-Ala carboxypeptidase family metallohydrolase [Gaiellaceae bacterium]|nr:D-Ala-D-Ala carboxypeptidase family metallohydrolase [Gaiellaceae bacterium]
MSTYSVTDTDDEAPEDPAEASEAEGVAAIDLTAPPLPADEAEALDRESTEGLEGAEGAEAAPAGTLSANFVLAEFHCCRGHCPQEAVPSAALPALRRLVTQVLQPMRDRFGRCTVHSGYRNARHNQHVGGVANSHHRYDVRPDAPAADVSFDRGTVNEWAAEARRLLGNVGGVGRYPSQRFVHVDLGALRRWDG